MLKKPDLFHAILRNQRPIIKKAYQNGLLQSTTLFEPTSQRPLMIATVNSVKADTFCDILSWTPDIDAIDDDGMTVLMHACSWNRHDLLPFLLSQKPNLNIQDCDGNTALHIACRRRSEECIQQLVHEKCSTTILNHCGNTAFQLYENTKLKKSQ